MKDGFIALVPIVGLLGVIIGAFLQGLFNRKNQAVNHLSELQNKAYSDFLNSVSKIAVAQRRNQRDTVTEQLANLADAKSRICVYGHANVVKYLAEFLRAGGTLQSESEILSFTNLCIQIRSSASMKDEEIRSSDISQLLFNVDVKDIKTPSV